MLRDERPQARKRRRKGEVEILELAVSDRVGDALERKEEHGRVLAPTPRTATVAASDAAEMRHEVELTAALRAVERPRGGVRGDERA